MRDQILGRLRSLQRSFGSFTAGQKTIAVIGGAALLLGAVMVYRWASAPSYAPLFTNLSAADASAVVDKLNSAGTPYQLTDGGTSVLVPQNDVYSSRISLSGEGLPSQGSEGYGLLDDQSLSTSQFQEQTSYKRAIEGELEKTIEALDPVNTAVVHVAMPQEELFSEQKQPTTASVLVATQPGDTLDTEQVQAVVHLVASSVEGLEPKQVTVTDSTGAVLSTAGDGVDSVGDTRSEQVKGFQDRMNTSVTQMLDRVLGPGNSSVQVTADLNFDKTVTHTTRYFRDPKVGALSDSTETEEYTGTGAAAAAPGGVVGPDGQLSANGSTGSGNPSYRKKNQTKDNAIGSTIEEREAAPGNVESLHVGVVVDTQSLNGATPQQIQDLVTAGLGLSKKRGDTVLVQSMPFDRTAEKAAAAELKAAKDADSKAELMSMVKTGGLVLVVLLALLVAWLRGRKRRQLREQATTYVVEQ
ncbi:MAG: flagellar M-ring protein FliF, partial [Nocardioidaceae bacterium]|nr:flagellar M-ring protein FliF [Nocardioidaceae bacterium]